MNLKNNTKEIVNSIYRIEEIMNNRTEEDSETLQMELLSFVTVFGEYCTKDLLSTLSQKATEMGCSAEEIEIAFSDSQTSENKPVFDQTTCSIAGIGDAVFSIAILEEVNI